MITKLKKLVLTIAALGALGLGGAALAGAQSADRPEAGDHADSADAGGEGRGFGSGTAQQARDAALKATGGGTANSFERDGENGATYEVEVTKPDGGTVDVRLDDAFGVVVIEGDGGE